MRLILVLLAAAAAAHGATCTLAGSANLSAASWDCGHTPNTSDTVVLNNLTLTADQNWTFGTGSGTVLTIGTGKLVVNGGVSVDVRGNATHAVVARTSYFIDQLAGSTLSVEGTVGAASTSKAGAWKCRNATITSSSNWSVPQVSNSTSLDWDGCTVSNGGSGGNLAVSLGYDTNMLLLRNSFSNTSTLFTNGPTGATGASTLVKWNTWSNPIVTAQCTSGMSDLSLQASYVNGSTEIAYNNFNLFGWTATCGGSAGVTTYASIHDNYFGLAPTFSGAPTLANNLFRSNANYAFVLGNATGQNAATVIFFHDYSTGNPHGVDFNVSGGSFTLNGAICSYAGPFAGDFGACVENHAGAVTASNVLALPGLDLTASSGNVFQPFGNVAGTLINATHATGYSKATFFFGYSHSIAESMSRSMMGTFRDHIVHSPGSTAWWFAWDLDQNGLSSGCAAYTATDITLANVGPNWGWPQTANGAEAGSCNVNSANGWGGKWSATPPGVASVYADPKFVDINRSPMTFPTKYLGRTASNGVWNSGTAYTQGQTVTSTDATMYGGAEALLFRCHAAGGCASGGPQPGVGASWRNTWEWEALYELRTQTPLGAIYQDGALALQGDAACTTTPCSIERAMYNWIMRGHIPQNPAFWRAASDGTTPGAVNVNLTGPATIGAI